MAKIKKIQEGGETIYPATITNAIKDVESGETLVEILENKANVDGTYPEMEVGAAYDVINDGSFTSEEISFRPSGGTNRNVKVNGVARIEKVKGNSVVWNQKMPHLRPFYTNADNVTTYIDTFPITINGVTFNRNADGSYSVKGTATAQAQIRFENPTTKPLQGHKYYTHGFESSKDNFLFFGALSTGLRDFLGIFTQKVVDANFNFAIRVYEGATVDDTAHLYVVDLTQMFGAGNEPTTIEQFYEMLPEGVDINAYNAGEIVDGNYGAIKTVGFNAYNGTYAKVCGGCPYYLGGNYTSLGFATEEGGTLEAITIPTSAESVGTTPSDRLYTPTQNGYIYAEGENININLSWDTEYGYLNGTYQPYKPFERDLSWVNKYFPNGMRSAGSVRDEIRFNSTIQKWEAVQRVGSVDLGTLKFNYYSNVYGGPAGFMVPYFTNMYLTNANTQSPNLFCELYPAENLVSVLYTPLDKMISGSNKYPNRIIIVDSGYTDKATFNAAMSGVMLNYELATPIITEIEETPSMDFDVSDYGTEELIVVEGVASAPLMADISYLNNTLSSIKQIPTLITKTDKAEEDIKNIKKEIDVIQEKNIEDDELEFYKAPNIEFIRPVAKDYIGYIGEVPNSIEEYIAGDYQIKISHPYYEKHKDECLLVIMKYGTLKRNINVPTLAKNSKAYFKPRTKWNFFKGGLVGNDSILTINNTIDENGFVTIRNFVDKILSRGVLKWSNEKYFIVAINYGDAEDALGVEVKSYKGFYGSPSQNNFITNDNMSDIFLSKSQKEQKFGIAVIKTNPEFIDADKPMDINEQHNICWSNGKYRWLISDITPFYMHVNLPMTGNNTVVNQHFISISK